MFGRAAAPSARGPILDLHAYLDVSRSRRRTAGRRIKDGECGLTAGGPEVRVLPNPPCGSLRNGLCPLAGSAELAPPGSAIVRGDRRAITPVDRGHRRHANPLPDPPPGRSPGRQSVHRPTHGYSLPRTMNAPCLRHFNPSLRCVTPPASSQVRSEGPIDQRLHLLAAADGDDDGAIHGDDVNRAYRAAFVGVVAR
jgi:hypothetical protein